MGILDSLKSVFTPNPEKIVAAASSPAPKSISSGPSSHSTTSFGSKPTTKSSGFPTGYVQSGTAKAGIPVQKERTLKDIFGPKTSATTPASSHVSGSFGPSSSTSSSPIKTSGSVRSGGSLGLKQALPGTTIPSDWGFKAPTGTLSRRAYNEGLRRGEKYNEATDDQKAYVRAYYDALDDDNVVKYYTRLESQLGQARGYNADRFNADYRAANDYLEQQLAARARVYGKESNEYRALKQVQDDFQKLGKDGAIKAASQQASNLSSNLDNTINDVFGGVINTADYAASVDRGRSGVEADKSAKKWFDNNLKNASDTQRNFMYAVFDQEGGLKGVKEKYNDFFGESMNAINASKNFAADMEGYDNPIDQFFGYIKNNIKSGWIGQTWGGIKQMFTNTEADPDDQTILGDYSITQAIDDSFKSALGDYADSLELQRYGGMGQEYMKQYFGGEEWFKDMQKEASDFQKLMIGNIFLNSYDDATNSFDPSVAKSTWESIKEQSKEIYNLVNGAMSLPHNEDSFNSSLYTDYFRMGGAYAPEFLGTNEDGSRKTWGQVLWEGGVTTSAQGPQAVAAWAAGGLASLVLGPEALAASQMIARSSGGLVMALSAYGNSYKEAVDSGHSVKEARWYGAVEAGNEFISDILLSGIGDGVGILTSGAAKKVVENIGSPLGRALIETGIDALGEGLQEYVQEVSEPLIRNLVFGEDNDVLTVENLFKNEDAAYSFFLGMFSSILMSAPAGLGRSVSNNTQAALYGKSLNAQQSTDKLIDTILNSDLQVKDKVLREEYEAAKETAQRMREGSNNRNDLTVGQMAMQFARAGGDMSFLTNPKTVAYTKDQITVEDMTAGAVSMLASMDGDTSLAEDIAKMAKGETVSEEVQQKINDDPKAKQVLEQLQGDLDMSADNALTRAAHETTKKGTQSKIADAVQQNNPNKVIYTPAEQYLNDNALTKPAETRRIGAVLNKVLDGIQITREEAKLLNAKKPGIHATLVDFMGLDISEYATTDQVMKALNDKAAEVAKTMDLQQGVRENLATQYRVVNRERRPGRGKPGLRNVGSARAASKTGGTNSETVRSNDQGRTAGVVQGVQSETSAVGEGAPGGVPAATGSRRTVAENQSPLPGPAGVIPSDQLTPELRNIQRRAASLGAGSVVFLRGQNSYCREIRAEDGSVSYEIGIRVDGPFTSDQYVAHEVTAHLWLKALSEADYKDFCGHVEMVFGDDFQSVYDQVKALYMARGYLDGLSEEDTDNKVREEMFALARGAQDYSKFSDPDCQVDFSQYKAAADALANLYSLEDMAKGNTSNREVKYKIDHGEFNREYYEAQGLLEEETAPKKEQSNAAKAFKPAQKQETKTAPKTEKRANPFTPTDEARERASKIPNKERKALHKEVADLRRQLRNDRALAENPEFLDQVRDWFNRANAAVERANASAAEEAVETAKAEAKEEVAATPETILRDEFHKTQQELQEKMAQLEANPGLENDPEFSADLNALMVKGADITDRLAQMARQETESRLAAKESAAESTFNYDEEFRKLTEDYARKRASQKRKLENNPAKSQESYNAQLRKLQDEYNYNVHRLQMEAKRNGDIRFSADPEVEELMDRSDEVYRDLNEEQRYQNAGVYEQSEEFNTDSIDDQINALMDELEHASPDRVEEIYGEIMRLQTSTFNETSETINAKAEKVEPEKPKAKPKTEQVIPKAEPKPAPVTEAKPKQKDATKTAFTPKAEKAKAEQVPVQKAEPREPTAAEKVQALRKKKGDIVTIEKGTRKMDALKQVALEKENARSLYAELENELISQLDSKRINESQYAKRWAKLIKARQTLLNRYDEQSRRISADITEAQEKEKATVVKDKETKYSEKKGEWTKRITNSGTLSLRRLRSDRNTYDVRITGKDGSVVFYNEVSPSMLVKALGEKFNSRALAKARLESVMRDATTALGEWGKVDMTTPAKDTPATKVEVERTRDNYGRKVPAKMAERMARTTVRDADGRLLNVYRLGPSNAALNANANAQYTLWTDRPAVLNLSRGLNGVEAYDQVGKSSGARIESLFRELEEHPRMSEGNKTAIRNKIAAEERKNREYTSHVTRLDPWRPEYANPNRADLVGNKSMLEGYLDIRSPLELNAKGAGMEFVQQAAERHLNSQDTEHDGLKITNVKVTEGKQTLGGGDLDNATFWVSFKHNQGKSSYNTDPTDSDLMQYSADPTVDDELAAAGFIVEDEFIPSHGVSDGAEFDPGLADLIGISGMTCAEAIEAIDAAVEELDEQYINLSNYQYAQYKKGNLSFDTYSKLTNELEDLTWAKQDKYEKLLNLIGAYGAAFGNDAIFDENTARNELRKKYSNPEQQIPGEKLRDTSLEGKKLSPQAQEYFGKTRSVDLKTREIVPAVVELWRASRNFGFQRYNRGKTGAIWLSTNKAVSDTYSQYDNEFDPIRTEDVALWDKVWKEATGKEDYDSDDGVLLPIDLYRVLTSKNKTRAQLAPVAEQAMNLYNAAVRNRVNQQAIDAAGKGLISGFGMSANDPAVHNAELKNVKAVNSRMKKAVKEYDTLVTTLRSLQNSTVDPNHRLYYSELLAYMEANNPFKEKYGLLRNLQDMFSEAAKSEDIAGTIGKRLSALGYDSLDEMLSEIEYDFEATRAQSNELLEKYAIDQETGEITIPLLALDTQDTVADNFETAVDAVSDAATAYSSLLQDISRSFFTESGQVVSVDDLFDVVAKAASWAVYAKTERPYIVDARKAWWQAIDMTGYQEYNTWAYNTGRDPNVASTDDLADFVQANLHRYDSLIILDVYDSEGGSYDQWQAQGEDGLGDDYVVFEPNQIKGVNNENPTESDYMARSADPELHFEDGTLERRILDIMRNKDEATAIEALRLLVSEFHQTGVMPEVENERVRNIFNPRMSNADTEAVMAEARKNIRRYGRLEPGMKPARDIPLPRRTPEGNLRRVFRTAAESKNTPERAVPIITREAMTREGATYQTITDKSAIAAAHRDMMTKGFDQVLAEWRAKADGDVESRHAITKYDVAKAEMLYTEAIKVGDYETGMEVLAELAEVGTTAGQTVQAMRMLKTMPASYQLYYMRRVANRLNRQYAKAIDNGRMSSITIDPTLARAVLRAQTQEEIDAAMENLIQSLADQVPATIADKWNAWRYLSMLGNPKTHIRNMLGNGIFVPAVFAKDLIAAGLESTFVKKENRQTSVKGLLAGMTTALGMNTSEYGAFAANDYEGIKDELQSGGKYNPTNAIMEKRTIFKWKPLEALQTANGNLLEWEDGLFLRMHYITAMTNFLSTQGMSVAELQSTNAGRKIVNAARAYAFNEAQKATYRDASQIAASISQAKRGSGLVGGILLEGILPFAKTPINILKRGIEYSPIGLMKSLTYDLAKMKSGEMTANEVIDHAAAGMTGTGIAFLGLYLASLGLLKGGDDDDDKQADFDKLQGYQNYSLNLGDYNYTIDWMAPGALPLFFGAELFNQLNDRGEGLTAADWINAATVIAEPFTQLSMLSGLNETLKSAKWDDHPLSSVVLSMGSGYVTQAVPTLLAQLSRSMVADRRTTYVDKNSQVPQPIQRWWQTNVLGKTPLNAERTEYIDAWGRKDTKASFLGRLAENMLSPGYLNRIKTTPVDAELQKLADEVGTGVLFTVPERSIEYNNQTHHLTAEQYTAYAKTRGDAAMSLYTDLFNSYEYQYELSADEKASAVGYLKDYANVLGKQAVFPDYDPTTDNWAEKCDGDTTRLVNMAMLKARAHDLGITAGNNGEFYGMIVSQSWMTPVDQAYAIAQQYSTGSADSIYERKGGPKYELTSERKQILAEHFRQVFPAYYIELVQTQQWQTADNDTRVDLLSKVRAEANADSKAWLAHILAEQGAPTYNPSK